MIGEICIRHNFKGENAFFIFEHFHPGFIQQYIGNLLNNDNLQACIGGWVDVLGEDYKAVLFLVEKDRSAGSIPFSINNIDKIYRNNG